MVADMNQMEKKVAKIYQYSKCSTCRKAVRYLDDKKVIYQSVPIAEKPPTKTELRRMLGFLGGDVRRLFNTSGLVYKALNLKERLPKMTEAEAINLLSSEGKLVKRPFVLLKDKGLVGFKEDEWDTAFSKS